MVAEHVMKCGSLFNFVKSEKKGFELMDFYQCKHCHVTLCNHACCSLQESAMKSSGTRGPKIAELNALMAITAYCSRVTPMRLEEMCTNAGIVCPTKSKLLIMYEKVKDSVLDLLEGVLQKIAGDIMLNVRDSMHTKAISSSKTRMVNGKVLKGVLLL